MQFASRQVARDIVDKIVEDGEFSSPEPYMNLEYAIQYAQTAYNRAKLEYCPEEHLELLRRFMEQAISLSMPPEPSPQPIADMSMVPQEQMLQAGQPMPQEGMPLMGDQMMALPQAMSPQ
jgi:hypothetical protein